MCTKIDMCVYVPIRVVLGVGRHIWGSPIKEFKTQSQCGVVSSWGPLPKMANTNGTTGKIHFFAAMRNKTLTYFSKMADKSVPNIFYLTLGGVSVCLHCKCLLPSNSWEFVPFPKWKIIWVANKFAAGMEIHKYINSLSSVQSAQSVHGNQPILPTIPLF